MKRATLADVAQRAGLSKTAVSLILNDRPGSRLSADAAQRARDAARELNYRPNPAARSLRMNKTRTVGFISDDVTVTRYASAMIRGALDAAEASDHTVLIAETGSDRRRMEQALNAMLDRRADGVVFALMAARRIELPPVPSEVPVVMLNGASTQHHPSVLPAEFNAGYRIARQLIDRGHRRIALIGYSPDDVRDETESVTLPDRFRGIEEAFAEAGIEPAERVDIRGWEPHAGYQATDRIIADRPDLTALLCMNDRLAFGTYQALHDHHLEIPADISVASFDDDEVASYLRPGLTTARIPYEEMGHQAMRLVLESGLQGDQHVPMPIQERASVANITGL